uniref:Putative secreted protein n=1 Tax=Psorophora albipes TaxID=869069 RepID=T1DJ57_9DIPT
MFVSMGMWVVYLQFFSKWATLTTPWMKSGSLLPPVVAATATSCYRRTLTAGVRRRVELVSFNRGVVIVLADVLGGVGSSAEPTAVGSTEGLTGAPTTLSGTDCP